VKVGDLVKARYWGTGYIGLVISIRSTGICRVLINTGVLLDQLAEDLEVINESR